MSTCRIEEIPEELIYLICSFGTIWDHAMIDTLNKYFKTHLSIYYQRQTHFDGIRHWMSHINNIENVSKVFIDKDISHWLSTRLINITSLTLNVGINESDLLLILKNKSKLEYLNISPIVDNCKISHSFISKLVELNPNIKELEMIGLNWNLSSFNQYQMYYSSLKQIEMNDKYNFSLKRLPNWFYGDWICFEDNGIPRAEIHIYKENGLFYFKRETQNMGVVTHLHYCNNYNLFSNQPVLKLDYWIPGWPHNIFGPVTLVLRKYYLSSTQIDEIKSDQDIQESIYSLYKEKIFKNKYHIEAMEVAQNTAADHNGILNEWPDDTVHIRHYGIWIKIVFDSA